MEQVKDANVLHRIDGRGVILKVKQALDIGKMCFSFVAYGGADHKATSSIDCYMTAEDFGLLMKQVSEKTLQTRIAAEKQKATAEGRQYPNAIYNSPMGGRMTNNGAVSRHFSIAPGSRAEVMFTGLMYAADKSGTGAFIPKSGSKPIARIMVPATYHDLALMAYKWHFLEQDYMSKRYCMEFMKSDYQSEQNDSAAPAQATPTQPTQPTAPTQPATATGSDDFMDVGDFMNLPSDEDLPFADGNANAEETGDGIIFQ